MTSRPRGTLTASQSLSRTTVASKLLALVLVLGTRLLAALSCKLLIDDDNFGSKSRVHFGAWMLGHPAVQLWQGIL